MMKRLLAVGLFTVASSAWAAEVSQPDLTQVSLEDLKDKCAEFARNDQMRPVSATISCSELSYKWVKKEAKPASLNNIRNVGATVRMKSMQVPLKLFDAEIAPTGIQCQNWVKVEQKIEGIDVEVACAELQEIDDLGRFCDPVIAERAGEDPGLLVTRETSESITACPAGAASVVRP